MMRGGWVLLAALAIASPAVSGIEVRRDPRGRLQVGNLPAGTYHAAPAAGGRADAGAGSPEEVTVASPDLLPLIREAAARHRLAPELVRAVVEVESAFDPKAVSAKGARGLMQLMPATAEELGVTDVYDPRRNLDGGSRYLRAMLDAFDGNLTLALAAYNAGPDTVRRYGGVPPYRETHDYIDKILERLRRPPRADEMPSRIYRYRDASGNLVISNLAPGTAGRQVDSAEAPATGAGSVR